MALTARLDLRQAQQLVMTPQLQQAIKLLQFNNLELSAFVEQELERNPLLERDDAEGSEGPAPAEPEPVPAVGALAPVDLEPAGERSPEAENALDMDYDNLWNNDSAADGGPAGFGEADAFASWGAGGRTDFSDPTADLEQTVSGDRSLRDHLLGQINMDIADPATRMVAAHLVDMLDEAGYFVGDVTAAAETLGCPVALVERTLTGLQGIDPPGVFARTLAECLAIQLRERDRLDPAMQALLDNLEMLARHDLDGLMRRCRVDAEDLAEMIGEIRALDPKPALAFETAFVQPVTPDVLMRPSPDGGWIVELNSETLPRVLVNNTYHARVSRQARLREDRQFIAECLQSANWLVKSLHQRATTILKVASEIVRQQEAFFAHGVRHLRPLVLRDIAEAIEMHESTVSRVTSNKYIATPRGIFELKYFFTAAIASSAGGEAHSAEAVRDRIRRLIEAEEADAVLSDDRIVGILSDEGIDIARRTVAKYREALRIPSSAERRRRKRAEMRVPAGS